MLGRAVWRSIPFALVCAAYADEEPPPPGLTPEQQAELKAELEVAMKEAEEAIARADALHADVASRLLLATSSRTFSIPPPPATPSVESGLQRGLLWIASQQRADGHWPGGACPLATMVFMTEPLVSKDLQIVKVRVVLAAVADPVACTCSDAGTAADLARALLARAAIAREVTAKREEVKKMVRRLLDMRHEDGWWRGQDHNVDGSATGWSMLALRAADLDLVRAESVCEFQMNVPSTCQDVSRIAVALLCRQDRPADAEVLRLTAQLASQANDTRKRTPEEWFLGVMALPREAQGFEAWRAAMTKALLLEQRANGSWAGNGDDDVPGAIRATALAILCLNEARKS